MLASPRRRASVWGSWDNGTCPVLALLDQSQKINRSGARAFRTIAYPRLASQTRA